MLQSQTYSYRQASFLILVKSSLLTTGTKVQNQNLQPHPLLKSIKINIFFDSTSWLQSFVLLVPRENKVNSLFFTNSNVSSSDIARSMFPLLFVCKKTALCFFIINTITRKFFQGLFLLQITLWPTIQKFFGKLLYWSFWCIK